MWESIKELAEIATAPVLAILSGMFYLHARHDEEERKDIREHMATKEYTDLMQKNIVGRLTRIEQKLDKMNGD